VNVRVAALRVMRDCERIDPDVIEPLTESENKRIRAAATAVMARHSTEEAAKLAWFKLALTDPCPCVRIEAARLLPELDPSEHKSVFRIALHDPNREVSGRARKLTQGKGYSKWRK
jgi:HEAT repeat protein